MIGHLGATFPKFSWGGADPKCAWFAHPDGAPLMRAETECTLQGGRVKNTVYLKGLLQGEGYRTAAGGGAVPAEVLGAVVARAGFVDARVINLKTQ